MISKKMDAQKKVYIKNRNIGRRKIDRTMRDRLNQYKKIFFVSQAITSEINMEKLFEIIMEQTNRIMGTERCTIFLYHNKSESQAKFIKIDNFSQPGTGMG